MATQQGKAPRIAWHAPLRAWGLLGLVLALVVSGVFIYYAGQSATTLTTVSSTKVDSPQAVPNSAARGTTTYVQPHIGEGGQSVPNPAMQAGGNYVANGYNGLPNHSGEQPAQSNLATSPQTVPNPATQGGGNYVANGYTGFPNRSGEQPDK